MGVFLTEWLFVLAMLLGFGAVGGFALVPFRQRLPFWPLASPLAGLLVTAFGVAFGYLILDLPFAIAVIGTSAAGLAATIWTGRRARIGPCRRALALQASIAALVAALFTAIAVSAAIEVGGPALHYWTGTDHLGYAHPADWIIAHPPSEHPRVDPSVPYESWPALMLEADPRFGSYGTVALVALVRGLPGTFAYDVTCAVGLSAAVLGVAAVFARSRLTLCLLVLALASCHWYDYSRAGYLGRALGYPAGGYVIGLLLSVRSPLRPTRLVSILLVAAGATTVYVADASLLFVGVVGGTFVAASVVLSHRPLLRRLRCLPWQHVVVLGLIVVVALAAKGNVARRGSPRGDQGASFRAQIDVLTDPSFQTAMLTRPWEEVRPTLLDLEQAHAPIGMLPGDLLDGAILVARAIWLALIVVAVLRRDPAALALALGPLMLLTLLNALPSSFARWVTAQLPGTFYPLTLGASAMLLDGVPKMSERRPVGRAVAGGLVALLVISIGLRVPRFVGAVDRYVGTGTRTLPPFSLAEIGGLAEAIGTETVRIDVEEPHLVLIALVELGRRGIDIQWGPRAWVSVASYRGWPAPEAATAAGLVLEALDEPQDSRATVVYRTSQYRLVRPAGARLP